MPPLRMECLVPTTEDWAPNLNGYGQPDRAGTFVRLKFIEFVDSDGYRVMVTGGDDDAMERDFAQIDIDSALELYELLKGCGPVSRADLREMGMVPG